MTGPSYHALLAVELQLDQPNRGSAPISGQVTREVADEPPPSIPLPRTSGGARPADAA